MKLVDQTAVDWQGRTQFFAVAAQAMRRILIDHARQRGAAKRGGRQKRLLLEEDLVPGLEPNQDVLAVDEALLKLAQIDPRQAQLVELRFFGGLSVDEAAEVMGMSKRSAEREWTMVRAWLRRELGESDTRMNAERHEQVKQIFLAACDLQPTEVARFWIRHAPATPSCDKKSSPYWQHYLSETIIGTSLPRTDPARLRRPMPLERGWR